MNLRQRELLLLATLAAAVAVPAFGQTQASGAASIPDLSRVWRHQSLPGLEPPASGPGPVTNKSRRNGVSNYDQLVGDYTNPILKPEAAEVVKKNGELSLAGVTFPSPANQCWPEPVGTRTDRPFAMLDLYGTPYTKALHVVERYRLIDYEAAQEGLQRDAKENQRVAGDIDPNYRGKFLQVQFTVEDEGVFTTPWTGTITYRPAPGPWQEIACAENTHEYYNNKESEVPMANRPDF